MNDQNADSSTDPASTAPETTDDPNNPQTEAQPAQEGGSDDPADASTQSREAARYRRRLRATEAERDQLSERVKVLQRAEVERRAAGRLATPGDLWLTDAELADMLDDDGVVDGEKVNATVDRILADRPNWQRTTAPAYDGGARTTAPPVATWQDILRGGRRR